MLKNIIIIFILICLTSCKPLLVLIYGVHGPRVESPEKIVKFYSRKGLRTDNILLAKDSDSWGYFAKKYGFPELICFNKKGEYFWYKDSAKCNAQGFSFTENICSKEIPEKYIDRNILLKEELNKMVTLNKQPVKIPEADFTVFIITGKFAGKLNKDHGKVWEDTLQNRKNCNINVYKLIMDPQKEWWHK